MRHDEKQMIEESQDILFGMASYMKFTDRDDVKDFLKTQQKRGELERYYQAILDVQEMLEYAR